MPAEGEFRPAVGIWVRGVFSTRRRDLIGALLGVCLFSFAGTRAGGGWEDSLVCVCVCVGGGLVLGFPRAGLGFRMEVWGDAGEEGVGAWWILPLKSPEKQLV